MAHTIQGQGNEDWTVTKKKRRGVEKDGNNEEMEEGAACRKFGIILGGVRMEVEVLAELHLRYPWIQLTRRIDGEGIAILITIGRHIKKTSCRTKDHQRERVPYRPRGKQARKAYIMM